MTMRNLHTLLIGILCCSFTLVNGQDDLMALLDEETPQQDEKVTATFKSLRVINAQTIETIKARSLMFRVTHRFGNISEGGHSLYGFDNASNIRLSFDYGVTDNLLVGFARSKTNEHLDGSVKYKLLGQTQSGKVPLTVTLFAAMGFKPVQWNQIYPGRSTEWIDENKNIAHRISYAYQVILARKFSPSFSLAILPTFIHRNYVLYKFNTANNSEEENDIVSIGLAGRIKVTKRIALVADYFYNFSKYREDNPNDPHYNPLGLGIEIETGGHVFHINFSNSSGIIENDFIPETIDSWLDGDVKMGFNISRVFYL